MGGELTAKSAFPCSRRALGSGLAVLSLARRELKLLFALELPVVEGWVAEPLLCLSEGSREAVPFGAGICELAGGWPWEDPMSRDAGGRALLCCLFFFPKRKDMAAGVRQRRGQIVFQNLQGAQRGTR